MAKAKNITLAAAAAFVALPTAASLPMPTAASLPTQISKLLVTDKLATEGKRAHDFYHPDNGRKLTIEFPDAQTAVPMDRRLAMKLVGNDGFEVRTPEGVLLRKRTTTEIEGVTIGADQCIAFYDELTNEALFSRVRTVPDHGLHKDSTREEMVGVLLAFNDPDRPLAPPSIEDGIELVGGDDGLPSDGDDEDEGEDGDGDKFTA